MRRVLNPRKIRLASLLAGSVIGCAAYAQSNVTIYGLLDASVEYINRVEGGGSITRMPNVAGGQAPSRLGFRGSEDLGSGLKAVFVLESGLSIAEGNLLQSGRAFGRNAYVGLQGQWGEVTMGRLVAMGTTAMMSTDMIGPTVYGNASFNTYIPNQRMDNAMAYRGTFGNWEVGAMYSFARDNLPPGNCGVQASKNSCSGYSALLKYDTKRWGINLAYNELKAVDGSTFGGQPAGLIIGDNSKDSHAFLTGYFMLQNTRIGGGVIRRDLKAVNETFRSEQYYLGVRQPIGPAVVFDTGYIYLNTNREQANAQMLILRATYNLSKRSSLALAGAYMRNQANAGYSVSAGSVTYASPGLGRSQAGMLVGLKHAF